MKDLEKCLTTVSFQLVKTALMRKFLKTLKEKGSIKYLLYKHEGLTLNL